MAESSIAVAVRIRPFSAKEANQLAPHENYQPFLGDGGLSAGSLSNFPSLSGSSSNAPSLRTKFLRPIISPVDDKVLIFDPPDNNPLTRLYSAGQNTFGHGSKKAKDVRYAFDRVFDEKCGQSTVFENTTKPLLDGILNGYNASVFAYGATGCGKTHTISGTPDDPGVIFLTMKDLYNRIESSREESEVKVRLSYLEIYNESIRDLLSPTPTPPGQGLMLREDAARKISVVGITEHIPDSPESVLEMIQEGNLRRTMSPTEANEVSSRSHAVLQINVTQRPRTADTITETTSASLNIIDLAGSERASATRNNGARMKEGANINKSLLALGNCINALCQSGGQRLKHVPYRNSKLTRLLKFSLGGNCKTVMIVCVSPSSAHYDETHNTLKYANQAKNIRTKVSRNMLNVDRHVAQYVQAIHELREEVAELKRKLADRNTLESASEKKRKADMIKEMQDAKTKIRESTDNVKRIVIDKAGVEARLTAAGIRLASLRRRVNQLDVEIQSQPGSSKDLQSERDVLLRMATREEVILQDETVLSCARNVDNSLQMHRGIIMAASQNTKFDVETADIVRTFGDCMLAEVEALQIKIKYEALKETFEVGMESITDLVTLGARSAFALQEATQQVKSSTSLLTEDQSSSLSVLSQQMDTICNDNDATFTCLIGTRATRDMVTGESNALQRGGRKQMPQPLVAPIRYPHQMNSRISVAGASNKALLPIKSPRKEKVRRSNVGPRRSGAHNVRSAGSIGRSFSNSMASAPKKSFRWADEAGEGRIDDHDRRSASPPHVRINVPLVKAGVAEQGVVLDHNSKARANVMRAEREVETGHSSGAEWEDVSRVEAGTLRGKREGSLFERNYLVKKEAKHNKLNEEGEEEADSILSDGVRAPLSDLSNGHGPETSSDDQSLVEFAPSTTTRSSPYRRRSSQMGPVRRKARSSIGETSVQSTKAGPTRFATGPPSFTASRSGRVSTAGGDSSRRVSMANNSQIKTVPLPSSNGLSHPNTNSSTLRSSVGAAWR